MSLRFFAVLLGALLSALAVPAPSAQQPVRVVTFTDDIGPLLATRCSGCHHPGGPAPFSVLTYEEVAPRARAIINAVETRAMAPWKPVAGYGGPFLGDRRVSDADLAMLRRWADEGLPRGAAAPIASHAAHDHNRGWQLGTPDLIVSAPEPFVLPEGKRDVFRNFAIRLPLEVARFVKGAWDSRGGVVGRAHGVRECAPWQTATSIGRRSTSA